MIPKLFFSEKERTAACQADDPRIARTLRVVIERLGKLRPVGIDNLTRDNIHLVSGRCHGQCDFLYIDELSAKIRMLGQIGILRVKVALRIEKDDMHDWISPLRSRCSRHRQ